MGAQRKLADPAMTAPPAVGAPIERVTPVDRRTPLRDDGDLPTSPAILLQEQLASRLAGVAGGTAAAQGAIDVPEVKWPMALRLVTIVALSLGLWAGVVSIAVVVIT